jgi:hypothetical protein
MGLIILWYWCIVVHSYMVLLDFHNIGICLIHDCGTWFMMETYHE